MQRTLFQIVAASVFGLVSVMHIVRIVFGWEVTVGPTEIPFSISWVGLFVAGALSAWGFASACAFARANWT